MTSAYFLFRFQKTYFFFREPLVGQMQWLGWASGLRPDQLHYTACKNQTRVWEVAKKVFFTSVLFPQIKHLQDQRGCSTAESRRWSEGLPVWTYSSDTRTTHVCDRVVIQTSSSLNLPHVAKKKEQRCKRKGLPLARSWDSNAAELNAW